MNEDFIDGALWEKRGQRGLYLIGHIVIDHKKIEIRAEANPLKMPTDNQPDFIIRRKERKTFDLND